MGGILSWNCRVWIRCRGQVPSRTLEFQRQGAVAHCPKQTGGVSKIQQGCGK